MTATDKFAINKEQERCDGRELLGVNDLPSPVFYPLENLGTQCATDDRNNIIIT